MLISRNLILQGFLKSGSKSCKPEVTFAIHPRHERPPRGQCLAAERQQQAQGHQRGRYFFMKKLLHVLILSPKVSAPLSWPFRRERNRV